MDIDILERNFTVHEMHAHHDHAGNPEEDDVKTGNQHIARIIFIKFRRFIRPAKGREWP